jgi:phosphate transport system substrate-binding protein
MFVTKITKKSRAAFFLLGGALLLAAGGCGDGESSVPATGGTSARSSSAGGGGRLSLKGSDTMLPLAQQWAQGFSRSHPGVNINVTGGGSSTGIVALINGTCDVANASRTMKDKEKQAAKAKGLDIKEIPVARDGLTIAVHPSNPVKSLTLDQVAGIYRGDINNWNEVGGPDLKIVAYGRDPASGTYGYFQEEVLKNKRYRTDMISTPSTNQIANGVAGGTGAIGYIGVAYADAFKGKVKEMPVAFKAGDPAILPTPENILAGKYPIARALLCYTRGEPAGVVKDYLDYVTGADGQKVVEKVGYVPLGDK